MYGTNKYTYTLTVGRKKKQQKTNISLGTRLKLAKIERNSLRTNTASVAAGKYELLGFSCVKAIWWSALQKNKFRSYSGQKQIQGPTLV